MISTTRTNSQPLHGTGCSFKDSPTSHQGADGQEFTGIEETVNTIAGRQTDFTCTVCTQIDYNGHRT